MDFKQLLDDYRKGKMDAAQRAAFEQLLHSSERESELQQLLQEGDEQTEPVQAQEAQAFIYARIKAQMMDGASNQQPVEHQQSKPVAAMRWWRYAAAVILICGVATLFYRSKPDIQKSVAEQHPAADILPGHDGAVLTLANGKKIVLDSMGNTVVAQQNGAEVVLKDGLLAYEHTEEESKEIAYNTMTTPRGRQFQLQLPDGTRVWLNAASSITYPTRFTGKERKVEIHGEAYFEVTTNTQMPFRVATSREAVVEVLGTSFNIHAYDDEAAMQTTLLNGAVKVHVGGQAQLLKPGQQAVLNAGNTLSVAHAVNLEQVMAWKNGLFNFDGYDLKAVMREIGRWYDLDIVYETEPVQEEMMGEIQRTLKLSQVMKILQRIHVHYRVSGNQLIITK